MPRLMSVAMTTDAVIARQKTVTRRKGWWTDKNGRRLLHPGDRLTLCGSGTTGCHGYIESHREEAYEQGLLLHQADNPEGISVHTFRGSLFLNNDGSLDITEDAQ